MVNSATLFSWGGAGDRLGSRGSRGGDHQPRQGVLSAGRSHEARPGQVLCRGRRRGAARDRGRPIVLSATSMARRAIRSSRSGHRRSTPTGSRRWRCASVGPDSARGRRARRGAAPLDRQPGMHRPEPPPVRAEDLEHPTSCALIWTQARRELGRRATCGPDRT